MPAWTYQVPFPGVVKPPGYTRSFVAPMLVGLIGAVEKSLAHFAGATPQHCDQYGERRPSSSGRLRTCQAMCISVNLHVLVPA